jgi:hypothetical protein
MAYPTRRIPTRPNRGTTLHATGRVMPLAGAGRGRRAPGRGFCTINCTIYRTSTPTVANHGAARRYLSSTATGTPLRHWSSFSRYAFLASIFPSIRSSMSGPRWPPLRRGAGGVGGRGRWRVGAAMGARRAAPVPHAPSRRAPPVPPPCGECLWVPAVPRW